MQITDCRLLAAKYTGFAGSVTQPVEVVAKVCPLFVQLIAIFLPLTGP